MKWTLVVAKSAAKQVAKLPDRDRRRIEAALLAMADDPFSGDTLKLEGLSNRWRRRVGDYRILFAVQAPRTIHVGTIARRTSTTY